jgi:hypothetical protein
MTEATVLPRSFQVFHPANPWGHLAAVTAVGGGVYILSCVVLQFRKTTDAMNFARRLIRR